MDEAQNNDVYYSSLEAHGQGTSRPTSSSTPFTSSLLSSLSSSAVSIPSTIPPNTSLTSLSSPSSSDTGFYFNDLSIIYNPRNFVYYDSKQARFGVDLGPRGNAEFVNIMLPPRWHIDDSALGVQEQLGTTQNVGSEDVWWNVKEGSDNATTTTGNIFNDNPNNNNNNNNTSTLGEDSIQSSSSSSGPKNNVSDVGVYFCLEDYINWRKDISAITTASSSATMMNVSTIAPSPQTNPADRIDSTRPLTILVRRGRCTFESKAQMAMVINEILSNSGRSNRIDHIIIYNNGTDDDNITDNKEELVDMGYEREMEDDDITVGLLYITSSSGVDLMRRITERQDSTFISPHLEVPMLSTEPNAHTLNRRHLESESSKPDWENDTITDQFSAKYHDNQISHGWWFPATLTRFCYSCGAEMQYGLVWEDVTDIHRFNDDGSETSPTQPFADGYPQDYFSDWFLYIRQFMIAILVLLLVGPILVFALRWYVVGGTFRIVTDENGVRRFRMVAPNLEAFVNGTPGAVEINGTKLDRAQVFSLPEIEYSECVDEENSASSNVNQTSFNDECDDQTRSPMQDDEGDRQNSSESAAPQAAPSNAPPTRSGRFISSSCCSICIDEFTLGERIRMLPRCGHGKFVHAS